MKNLYFLIICVCILSVSHFNAFAQNVNFPDANLAAAVRSKLGLAEGADIPQTSLATVTTLSSSSKGITNLTGLEYATGLTFLQLRDNPISDFSPISSLTNLQTLNLIETGFSSSDLTILSPLRNLENLFLSNNEISDLTDIPEFPNLLYLGLRENGITTITPLGNLTNPTNLKTLTLNTNEITDVGPLAEFTGLTDLYLAVNKIRDVTPLGNLTNLKTRLRLQKNRIRDLSPLATLTKLEELYIHNNQISDFSPLKTLEALKRLTINCNQYTDISPLKELMNLAYLRIDEVFYNANKALVEEIINLEKTTIDARSDPCPEPEPETEPETELELESESELESEPKVKQRRIIARCGLGWSPHSQYQHHGELPKVMIYALEFEYDPEGHGRYICKTIEIRTGDDAIENLAGWNLYLGTLYNPSRIPLKIPEESSQITDRILRITPEMLGLETFPCNTVNGISHPLPGVQYVLKTDENVLIDTAYSCFVWGQNAYTTVNDKNVESPRRISSQALREMDTPRIERYITNPTGIFITYIPFEDFAWDRAVLSDWLLASSEETVAGSPNAPFLSDKKLTTTWGAIKKHPTLRQSNFKHKPVR